MLPTYQDFLKAAGIEELPKYSCPQPGCIYRGPAFTIVNVAPEGSPPTFICSNCHIEEQQQIASRARMQEEHENAAQNPWDTDHGIEIRAIRNRLLETSNWAIQADSPLTPSCRLMFVEYRKLLNRVTLDYPTPYLAVMPEPPELEYVTS